MSVRNDNLEVILFGWIDGVRRRDPATIEPHLHPDVVWQGVRSDFVCRDRAEVLALVRRRGGPPDVAGLELIAEGSRVMLGVRSPDLNDVGGVPLEQAVFQVFTLADGLIVRMDAHRTREEALAALRGHAETAEEA
jgi:hypothetical protein